MRQIIYTGLLLSAGSMLAACQSPQYVTRPNYPNEAALVANAYANGLSAEIELPYLQAYYNLKQAYQRCVAFTADQSLVFTDNRLEQQLELGTLFARNDQGAYLHKTLVEGLSSNKTRISLFLPKNYKFAQRRFQQDVSRALGQDQRCNIGAVIPVQA